MDPTPATESVLSVTWIAVLLGGAASFVRMLMVYGIVEGWKRVFDTDIDPQTLEPITIFAETTQRGVAAVTQADLDEFEATGTRAVLSPSKRRVFKRPLWFSKVLPALPWFHGILFGIAIGLPLTIACGVVPAAYWPHLVIFHGVVGFGEGGSAHFAYRAFDNAGGYDGLVKFLRDRLSFLVKKKTGEPNSSSEPTDGDST